MISTMKNLTPREREIKDFVIETGTFDKKITPFISKIIDQFLGFWKFILDQRKNPFWMFKNLNNYNELYDTIEEFIPNIIKLNIDKTS